MANLPQLDFAETGYVFNGAPAFEARFQRAMSFHAPEGLAAVADSTGAYHIDASGRPRYHRRYLETFGFYEGIATVRDDAGYFHIDVAGRPVHDRRFRWSGNFQERLCAVQDAAGFFHVDADGRPLYEERFRYVGDYRHGVAVVHGPCGARHIRHDGSWLHANAFVNAQVFHKGHAVVEDSGGTHHVDKQGAPLHSHRFRSAEPFYNGVALCHTKQGHPVRLHESGFYTHLMPRTPTIDSGRVRDELATGARVGLFLRHAERPKITSGWGNEVLLTTEGLARCKALGRQFCGHSLTTHSSPIERCCQTARSFAEGANQPQEPRRSQWLGDPGPFSNPNEDHGVAPREFSKLSSRYVASGRALGMHPLEVACESLLGWLDSELAPGLTLFVSHDFFAAGLLRFLGLKFPTPEDWPDFLEGICLVKPRTGALRWHRFLGRDEAERC